MNKPQLFVNLYIYIYIKKFFKGKPPFSYQDSIVLVVKKGLKKDCSEEFFYENIRGVALYYCKLLINL